MWVEAERAESTLPNGISGLTEEYCGGTEEVQDSPGSSSDNKMDGKKGETLMEEGAQQKEDAECGETDEAELRKTRLEV
ncbi:hypothetical protein NDU88_004960 [Pleurodeles waltl]|uniref:Uncharacterized protein n=1 Tax=Pleurodeles waltl TaxID=8319 RepID=A0AAV7SKE3_PLEWA|nr:hypothetical protein NDU88_004960 [Pleurodeles waltl]